MIHDFRERLAFSEAQADEPWWVAVYRQTFPSMVTMTRVPGPNRAQENGVDRLIFLAQDKVIRVDEKTRKDDWPDIALEVWSNHERQRPGWIAKPLTADFIAYAFKPSRKCYMLPVPQLQRAWNDNATHWKRLAQAGRDGFKKVSCQTLVGGDRYTTISVAVPTDVLLDAIKGSILVRWTEEDEKAATAQLGLFTPAVGG